MVQRAIVVGVVLLLCVPGSVGIVSADLASDAAVECEYPLTIEDGTGANVTIDSPPEEIVVTHASTAQVVHDIEGWDRVIGAPVTPFTAYLDDYDEPHDVTDEEGWPLIEEIIDQDPDIVIMGHVGDPETAETLRAENLTVYMGPPPASIDDIATKVLVIGALIDACDEADDTVAEMADRLDAVEDLAEDTESPIVYYELGDGWTTGAGTFQHDVILRAGAENLGAHDGAEGWYQISDETVVEQDPEWIVYGDSFEEPPVTEAVGETPAIQENRTIAVNNNYINQAGPRVVLVIETIAEAIHDDDTVEEEDETTADDAADTTEEEDDSDAVSADAPEDDGDEETTDDQGVTVTADDEADSPIPGFGVVVAVIALAFAGLLARRR